MTRIGNHEITAAGGEQVRAFGLKDFPLFANPTNCIRAANDKATGAFGADS